jgi:glutamate:GABA antiporter
VSDTPPPDAALTAAEERVEARSAVFRKELGLLDLVLMQVIFVVGMSWVGTAAKLGDSQVVYWLLALASFYVPQAVVVIWLSKRFPLEGGLYQWAKLGFNPFVGFMVAWNLWLFAVSVMSAYCLGVATNLSYLSGPGPALAESKPFISAVSLLMLATLVVLSVRGLGVAKWVHNAAGMLMLAAFVVLIALPFVRAARGIAPVHRPLAIVPPALSLLSINIFSKMAVGALSGFEYVAIVAGETRHPERIIGRSVIIAAPIIGLMFILGTGSMLAIVGPDRVDLISPIPQAFRVAFSGAATWIGPLVILMLTARTLASASIVFTGTARMPMVAGWDNLLPAWFTRLHPRWRTPVNSIFFVGALSLLFTAWGIAGVGAQEAFQLIDNAAGLFYALTYLVMFALPVAGFRAAGLRAPVWLVGACVVGFLVTALFAVLSVFPIVAVRSVTAFSAKMIAVVVAANLAGASLYLLAERRRARVSGFGVRDAERLVASESSTPGSESRTPNPESR